MPTMPTLFVTSHPCPGPCRQAVTVLRDWRHFVDTVSRFMTVCLNCCCAFALEFQRLLAGGRGPQRLSVAHESVSLRAIHASSCPASFSDSSASFAFFALCSSLSPRVCFARLSSSSPSSLPESDSSYVVSSSVADESVSLRAIHASSCPGLVGFSASSLISLSLSLSSCLSGSTGWSPPSLQPRPVHFEHKAYPHRNPVQNHTQKIP
jgi:hypothetical protein